MADAINPTQHNFTVFVTEVDDVAVIPDIGTRYSEEEYEKFLADIWVGVVLTLMVLSCVCCVCSCLLYHKFQQWKRSVLESRAHSMAAGGVSGGDVESLPSYTVVSGLPTYDEALEQLRQVRELRTEMKMVEAEAQNTQNNGTNNGSRHQQPLAKLAVTEFTQYYKSPTVN